MPAPLPWRKFPRDLMVKPEIQYIIKRLAPEKKHAVFTVITAFYCYADDYGVVDISDQDLFVDICLFETPSELFDILDRLEARKLITRTGEHSYQIEGWEPPLMGTPRTATGESWGERLQRTSASARRAPDEPTPAELAALAMADSNQPNEPARPAAPPAAPDSPAHAPAPRERQKRPRSNKKNQNDTETINVSVSQQIEKREEETRPEEMRPEESRGEETITHTQITAPPGCGPAASVELRSTFGRDGPPPGFATPEQPSPEREDRERIPDQRGRPDETSPEEIRTDVREKTGEGGTVTDVKAPRSATDETAPPGQEADTGAKEDWLWSEVKGRLPPGGIAGNELEKPFRAFSEYFRRQNPGGYADQERETDAIMALSVRAHGLGSVKNPSEIVACTMTGLFQKLINSGGYFEGMACTPSMLIKPGNYQKVLTRLSKTLFPRENEPAAWKKEHERLREEAEAIRKATENEVPEEIIAVSYEKYGIEPDDPDRFRKLQAAKRASGE